MQVYLELLFQDWEASGWVSILHGEFVRVGNIESTYIVPFCILLYICEAVELLMPTISFLL